MLFQTFFECQAVFSLFYPINGLYPIIEIETIKIANIIYSVKTTETPKIDQYDASVLGMNQIFKPNVKHFEAVTELINVLAHPGDHLGDSLNIIRYIDRGSKKRLVSLVVFLRQIFYK